MRVVPFFVAVFILVPFVARAAGPVAISRVAAYPISDHEWIEIENTGTEAVDLTGWKFWEDGVNHGITSFVGGGILAPGQRAVIADQADLFLIDHPEYTGTLFDSSWSTLTLTGEPIGLRDPAGVLTQFPEQLWLGEAPEVAFPLPEPPLPEDPPIPEPAPEEIVPEEPTPTETLPLPEVLPEVFVEEPIATTSTEIIVNLPTLEEPAPTEAPFPEIPEDITTTNTPAAEIPPIEEISVITPPTVEPETPSVPTETETVPETVEVTTTLPPPTGDVHTLLLSEAMPAPVSGDEWVEIHNPTEYPISLEGLKLHDSVGSVATLSGTIHAFGYTVVTLSSARLNNSGDDITLISADGDTIDAVTYGDEQLPAPEKGQVIARDGALWLVSSTTTPGEVNDIVTIEEPAEETPEEPEVTPTVPTVVSPPAVPPVAAPTVPSKLIIPKPATPKKATSGSVKSATTTTAKTTTKKETAPKKTVIVKKTTTSKTVRTYLSRLLSALGLTEDGAYVVTEGTVVGMDSATSGKQWYLQDGSDGVRLSVTGFPPDLEKGLRVRVRGKLSWSNGPSIATTAADITALEATTTISPTTVELSALGPADGHRYVTVHGTVTSVRERRITLTNNNFSLTVIVPAGVAVPGKDAEITASGIYQSAAPPTLLVLSPNDLAATHANPAPPKTKATTSSKNTKKSPWPMTIGFGTLAAVAGTTIHRARKSRLSQSPILIPEDHVSSR